jgi:hypothetical protein
MLDLRLPIGLLFSTVGLLLTVYGWLTRLDDARYHCSLGINVNLYWGLFLTAFGLLMFIAGYRAQAQDNHPPKE